MQALPTRGFERIDLNKAKGALTQDPNANKGFIIEVDLVYASKMHKPPSDYPLPPERLAVKKACVSEYQLTFLYTMYRYIKLSGKS